VQDSVPSNRPELHGATGPRGCPRRANKNLASRPRGPTRWIDSGESLIDRFRKPDSILVPLWDMPFGIRQQSCAKSTYQGDNKLAGRPTEPLSLPVMYVCPHTGKKQRCSWYLVGEPGQGRVDGQAMSHGCHGGGGGGGRPWHQRSAARRATGLLLFGLAQTLMSVNHSSPPPPTASSMGWGGSV